MMIVILLSAKILQWIPCSTIDTFILPFSEEEGGSSPEFLLPRKKREERSVQDNVAMMK
jgi:hypothetical protein